MTTNPESLLAVTQEGEAIAGRLCDWDREGEPPVPLMQDAARFIRKHLATRPAPPAQPLTELQRLGQDFDADGTVDLDTRMARAAGNIPAQPGREEAFNRWHTANFYEFFAAHSLGRRDFAKKAFDAGYDAAEPLLARQAEPVAWMYGAEREEPHVSIKRWPSSIVKMQCWTETPLYAHPATLPTDQPQDVRPEAEPKS